MIGTRVLEEKKSKYNGNLRVVKTIGMGTYIQAEGLTQSGGIVETIWKQTLRRVKSKRQELKKILILGLGGGTVAKLIRKKYSNAEIIGIEIDPVMIDFGKKYLDLDKINIDIKISDAFGFIESNKKKYDLIVVDLYSGDQFPKQFEKEYYIHLVRINLARSGVAIFNRLYYGDKRPEAVRFGRTLEKTFGQVEWFYPEANLMFLCSNNS